MQGMMYAMGKQPIFPKGVNYRSSGEISSQKEDIMTKNFISRDKQGIITWYVVDADIQGYFGNINHEILQGLLNRRISVLNG